MIRHPEQLTPREAVDLHMGLSDWLRTDLAARTLDLFSALFAPNNGPFPDFTPGRERASAMKRLVDTADTFYVTAEMIALARDAADDLEGMPLFELDLPSKNAMILLDAADPGFNYGDFNVETREAPHRRIRAIHLHSGHSVRLLRDGQIVTGPDGLRDGLGMFLWTDPAELAEAAGAPLDMLPDVPLFPIDYLGWAFNERWQSMTWGETFSDEAQIVPGQPGCIRDTARQSAHVGELRRHLLSILMLMGQETTRERLDRPTRRRWQRSGVTVPEDGAISVTRLRHTSIVGADGTDVHSRFSHRFLVRGHWRRIHRGTERERAVWVRPCVKGPGDAPLVTKHKVTVLDR